MSTMWNVTAYDNYANVTIQEGFVGPPGPAGASAVPLWVISIPNPVPGTIIPLLLSAPKAFVVDSLTRVTVTGTLSHCSFAAGTVNPTATFTAGTATQTLSLSFPVAIGEGMTLGIGTGTATGLTIQIQGHYT